MFVTTLVLSSVSKMSRTIKLVVTTDTPPPADDSLVTYEEISKNLNTFIKLHFGVF